jgi:UDP-N-acetylmuramate--alanine ligase
VPADGTIITDTKHPHIAPLLEGLAAHIVDYTTGGTHNLRLPGEFNQANARAAAAAARIVSPSVTEDSISTSLSHFHGTWRRFEYKGKTKTGADVYDDYAHHPTAVTATIAALREKTKGKIFIAFHPHLYSRTRDLLDGFSTAFTGADHVLIAPIFAAREVDDGTISSEILAERIKATGTDAAAYPSFEAIGDVLETATAGDSIMTMGAGDIYKLATELVSKG